MKQIHLVALALAATACAADEPGRITRDLPPADVVVSVAQRGPVSESFPAVIEADQTAEVATRTSGSVVDVLVDVGSSVRAGAALVRLDATDVGARVAAARAAFELAERTHARIQALADSGAASRQELDGAVSSLAVARAGLGEAEAQEAYVVVRAPFDGVVVRRAIARGDLAVPGVPLLTLVAPNSVKVVADLPARRVGDVAVGAAVMIDGPSMTSPAPATVIRVSPVLTPGSRTFRVEARIDDGWQAPVPGAYVRLVLADIEAGPRWIPEDAVLVRGQLRGVMAVEADTLRLRWVRLGQRRDGAVELLSGPTGPLTVVRRPSSDLFDGRSVGLARTEDWVLVGGLATSGLAAVEGTR